jgi:polar amino acid transport system substrate-binding protein
VKNVGDPLYGEPLAVAFDKKSPVDNASLVEEVSQIVEDMHADGTLTALSEKWYGEDITKV